MNLCCLVLGMQFNPASRNKYFNSSDISIYLNEYSTALIEALNKIDLARAKNALATNKGRLFVGGNGGSAAISDHLACDFEKGCNLQTNSLVGRTALFTAIANDLGYDQTLIYQLDQAKLNENDIVLLISSSGNSPNIVKAAVRAREVGAMVIGVTGFSGGSLRQLSDISLHMDVYNYGVIEDGHQVIMHVLAQFIHLEAK